MFLDCSCGRYHFCQFVCTFIFISIFYIFLYLFLLQVSTFSDWNEVSSIKNAVRIDFIFVIYNSNAKQPCSFAECSISPSSNFRNFICRTSLIHRFYERKIWNIIRHLWQASSPTLLAVYPRSSIQYLSDPRAYSQFFLRLLTINLRNPCKSLRNRLHTLRRIICPWNTVSSIDSAHRRPTRNADRNLQVPTAIQMKFMKK